MLTSAQNEWNKATILSEGEVRQALTRVTKENEKLNTDIYALSLECIKLNALIDVYKKELGKASQELSAMTCLYKAHQQ